MKDKKSKKEKKKRAKSPSSDTSSEDSLPASTSGTMLKVKKKSAKDALKVKKKQETIVKLAAELARTSDPAKKAKLQRKITKKMSALDSLSEGSGAVTPKTQSPEPPKPQKPAVRNIYLDNNYKRPATSAPAPIIATPNSAEEVARRQLRQQRFQSCNSATASGKEQSQSLLDLRASGRAGLGTNTSLEKEYLRLTSAPDAATVRPPRVLAAALQLVQQKWLEQPSYQHACDQLKAIRQDLTVQHLRNELTVRVYETHARLALEVDDVAEYNQCQTVLRDLYSEGVKGNKEEFVAYRLLYSVRVARDHYIELRELTPELRAHAFVRHALEVCKAVAQDNYYAFFRLFRDAPRMSPYLMDHLAAPMRVHALQAIIRAYNSPPALPLSFVADQLGFGHTGSGTDSVTECIKFVGECGAVVDTKLCGLDTTLSRQRTLGPPLPP